MAIVIYALCAVTCLVSAWLLLRGYRRSGHRLLFWGGLCFVLLTVSNTLNITDRIAGPELNLIPARLATAMAAVLLILFALIWGEE
jgi:hypothetical protein